MAVAAFALAVGMVDRIEAADPGSCYKVGYGEGKWAGEGTRVASMTPEELEQRADKRAEVAGIQLGDAGALREGFKQGWLKGFKDSFKGQVCAAAKPTPAATPFKLVQATPHPTETQWDPNLTIQPMIRYGLQKGAADGAGTAGPLTPEELEALANDATSVVRYGGGGVDADTLRAVFKQSWRKGFKETFKGKVQTLEGQIKDYQAQVKPEKLAALASEALAQPLWDTTERAQNLQAQGYKEAKAASVDIHDVAQITDEKQKRDAVKALSQAAVRNDSEAKEFLCGFFKAYGDTRADLARKADEMAAMQASAAAQRKEQEKQQQLETLMQRRNAEKEGSVNQADYELGYRWGTFLFKQQYGDGQMWPESAFPTISCRIVLEQGLKDKINSLRSFEAGLVQVIGEYDDIAPL